MLKPTPADAPQSRYAVIGWPVEHSVSPQMQQAGFQALGIPASYEKIPVEPEHLGAAVEALRTQGFAGWNVTVPHKEQIADFLDQVDPGARRAGSINTVVRRGKILEGYSTDGYGLAMATHEAFGVDLDGRTVAFLGCGGAARATAVYFAAEGAREIVLINRTIGKAYRIRDIIQEVAPDCRAVCIENDNHDAIRDALKRSQILYQATSLGLRSNDPMPLDPELLPQRLAVMDMIYRPTPFLNAATERGCQTADGRAMLLHQGARSLMMWTGHPAPLEAMRQALWNALAAR